MDARRFPPLNTLRGFEAAARHLSFTLAARELHVTQGAISRQVRELERFLGRALFRRMTRRIALTPDGRDFLATVERALFEIEEATSKIQKRRDRHRVTVSVLPTLSSLWLMPRLHLFNQAHPDVEVTTISSIEAADLLAHQADVAIRAGRVPGQRYGATQPRIALEMVTDWTGVHADRLFPDVLVPVCARSLIADTSQLQPDELLRYPLIHISTRPDAWTDWLSACGVSLTAPLDHALEFGHFFMALDAAREGLGVAIVPKAILLCHPARDELIIPVREDPAVMTASAGEYHLLIHESRWHLDQVQKFRKWLLEQAAALRSGCG
jgi:LysR family transcriptional regulator, glycine cleavage system transcriptional activator